MFIIIYKNVYLNWWYACLLNVHLKRLGVILITENLNVFPTAVSANIIWCPQHKTEILNRINWTNRNKR